MPVVKKPPERAIMERFAPNTAPLETPKVEGDAMALFRVLCIIRPATLRPAPATMAASTRGMRIFQMIRFWAGLPLPIRAFKPSATVILDEPANKQQTASTATAIPRLTRVTRLRLLIFCNSCRFPIKGLLRIFQWIIA